MAYNIAERRLKKLLDLKIMIQDLEQEQEKQRQKWKEAQLRVRQIGQELTDKRQELMNNITT